MRRKHAIVAIALVVCLVIGVVAALAAKTCGIAGQGKGMKACLQDLDLTPQQSAQLMKIGADFVTATAPQREDLKGKMKELIGLATAENPDAAAIKSLAAQADAVRADIRDAMVDSAIQAMSVMTPEQRAKVRAKADKMCNAFCVVPGAAMGCCSGSGMGCEAKIGKAPACPMGANAPAKGCCPLARK